MADMTFSAVTLLVDLEALPRDDRYGRGVIGMIFGKCLVMMSDDAAARQPEPEGQVSWQELEVLPSRQETCQAERLHGARKPTACGLRMAVVAVYCGYDRAGRGGGAA